MGTKHQNLHKLLPWNKGTIQNPSVEGNYSPPPLNSLYGISVALSYSSSDYFPNMQHASTGQN